MKRFLIPVACLLSLCLWACEDIGEDFDEGSQSASLAEASDEMASEDPWAPSYLESRESTPDPAPDGVFDDANPYWSPADEYIVIDGSNPYLQLQDVDTDDDCSWTLRNMWGCDLQFARTSGMVTDYPMSYTGEGQFRIADILTVDEADERVGINTTSPVSDLEVEGRLELQTDIDASGTPGDGNIEIGNNLRIDANEIITNTGNPLYLNYNNNGDIKMDIDTLYVDASTDRVGINTSTPTDELHVVGKIRVASLGTGGTVDVCRNSSYQLSTCSSSRQYKESISDLTAGIDVVERLRPVTFAWTDGDGQDFGFIAEEVAEIDPLFATYVDGKVEGVKYKQLTAVLANAIKELKAENDDLKALVCQDHPKAKICR